MAERTLVQKLGLKPGMVACKVNAPPEYQELVQEADVDWLDHMVLEAEFIHVFTTTIDELWALVQAGKYHMSVSGALWISWPKKASGITSSLSFGVVRRCGLDAGLVDIKVCSVDSVWSALKFVYRKRDRGKISRATRKGSQPST